MVQGQRPEDLPRSPGLEYLRLVLEHLGAGRIREHVARDDWEERIRADEKVKAVRGLMATPP